ACGLVARFRCCETINLCVTPAMWVEMECGSPDAAAPDGGADRVPGLDVPGPAAPDAADVQLAGTGDGGRAAERPEACVSGGGVRAAYFWGEDFEPPAVVVRDEVGFRLDWKDGSPHP